MQSHNCIVGQLHQLAEMFDFSDCQLWVVDFLGTLELCCRDSWTKGRNFADLCKQVLGIDYVLYSLELISRVFNLYLKASWVLSEVAIDNVIHRRRNALSLVRLQHKYLRHFCPDLLKFEKSLIHCEHSHQQSALTVIDQEVVPVGTRFKRGSTLNKER